MKRAERTLALLRCSAKKQDQEMAAQRADIERWAVAAGVTIAPEDWREEPAVSGKSRQRTELERIREEAREGLVSRIVFADLDRAGRLGARTVVFLEDLHEWKVDLVFVREMHLSFDTYEGRGWILVRAGIGMMKLGIVSASSKAGLNGWVKDGLRVAPGTLGATRVSVRNSKRVGRLPLVWAPEADAALLAARAAGKTLREIAAEPVAGVLQKRAVDADGHFVTKSEEPIAGWVDVPQDRVSVKAVRSRLLALGKG